MSNLSLKCNIFSKLSKTNQIAINNFNNFLWNI